VRTAKHLFCSCISASVSARTLSGLRAQEPLRCSWGTKYAASGIEAVIPSPRQVKDLRSHSLTGNPHLEGISASGAGQKSVQNKLSRLHDGFARREN
jgi:hypothetical protein